MKLDEEIELPIERELIDLKFRIERLDDIKNGASVTRFRVTPDANITRLNPNHKLDLINFETQRFWPRDIASQAPPKRDTSVLLQSIASRLALNVSALINGVDSALPISGGYDSRILLLMAKKLNASIGSVYTHRTNWISGYDALMGSELCALLGIQHHFLDASARIGHPGWHKKASEEQLASWVRAGFAKSMPRKATSLAPLLIPECKVVLRGNIMEILGGRFHKINSPANIDGVYKYVFGRQPKTQAEKEHWKASFDEWRSDLPPLGDKNTLDLCFLEGLYPSDMSVALLSMPRGFYVNPFADRRLISWTMQYPSELRMDGQLLRGLLKWANPEIPIPINPKKYGRLDKDGKILRNYIRDASPALSEETLLKRAGW